MKDQPVLFYCKDGILPRGTHGGAAASIRDDRQTAVAFNINQ
ncbi:hypothetical protein [Paenibacillus ginsengarvi]|nr:hypothetical protein [Paenibacillus ginsengarvi]